MSPPATAFAGGRILTMDPRTPRPQVVVVREGRIADVGPRGLLERWPDAERVDLAGRTLVPGLIDAHNHLSVAALHPRWADLSAIADLEGLANALRVHAAREPNAAWLRGQGWGWIRSLQPTRRDLDALGLDRPVVVAHFSLHQCVVDSRALEVLGIGRATPDPPGGEIQRDASGEPTGLLIERAWSQAHAASVRAYADPDRWGELIVSRAGTLLAEGITCVHDAACSPEAEAVYRTIAASGRLPVSVLVMPHPAALLDGPRLDGPPTGEGDERLRVGAIKLFADGGTHLSVDATWAGQRVTMGHRYPNLAVDAAAAAERGFRVAVHAMGNEGLERTLDAFARVAKVRGDDDHRFRVEHVTLAGPEHLRRMRELGAVGVVQPGFVRAMGALVSGVALDEVTWLPFASLLRAGVTMAASSDDPCADWQPMLVAAMGATRLVPDGDALVPEEAVAVEEWLRAYTVGAAYAGRQEHERGAISPGLRADLVVLDESCVAETWVNGERVFSSSGER